MKLRCLVFYCYRHPGPYACENDRRVCHFVGKKPLACLLSHDTERTSSFFVLSGQIVYSGSTEQLVLDRIVRTTNPRENILDVLEVCQLGGSQMQVSQHVNEMFHFMFSSYLG